MTMQPIGSSASGSHQHCPFQSRTSVKISLPNGYALRGWSATRFEPIRKSEFRLHTKTEPPPYRLSGQPYVHEPGCETNAIRQCEIRSIRKAVETGSVRPESQRNLPPAQFPGRYYTSNQQLTTIREAGINPSPATDMQRRAPTDLIRGMAHHALKNALRIGRKVKSAIAP